MREILVPIELGGASERACDLALALARVWNANVVLLRVVEPLPVYVVDAASTSALLEGEAKALAHRADALRPHAPSLETMLVAGSPWEQIARVAEERNVDMVVIGTHARRGLSHALLGSVAERVVRVCKRPVMTVPAWIFASREAAAARLAREIGPLGLEAPLVVALTATAVPIAKALARDVGGAPDVWLVGPVVVGGEVVGAVTEEGLAIFDREPTGHEEDEARRVAVLAARRLLEDELMVLRHGRSIGETWHRDVVLVTDGLASASPLVAAARSVRAMTPRRLVAAVPIVAHDARAAVEREVDRLIGLETAVGCEDPTSWYAS